MKCCGQDVVSPYCPFCGSAKNVTPLASLYKHCVYHAAYQKKRVDARGSNVSLLHISTLRKWESWVEALATAIKEVKP